MMIVEHDHVATTSPEDERCGEPGRTSSDDHDIDARFDHDRG
jgi:hypothetical protein